MSQNISRFLQLSPVSLLEYEFNECYDNSRTDEYRMVNTDEVVPFVFNLNTGDRLYVDTNQNTYKTNNIVNGISIPHSTNSNTWFHITDEDVDYNMYVDAIRKLNLVGTIGFLYDDNDDVIPYDTIKVYYISGYHLNESYGMNLKVSVNDDGGKKVILANLLFNKESVIDYTYLTKPLFVSNRIYDKYIEIKIPSVKYICNNYNKKSDNGGNLAYLLNVSQNTPIRIEYADVFDSNVTPYSNIDQGTYDVVSNLNSEEAITNDAILFTYDDVLSTSLPQNANSDNFTSKIEVKKNYIEFAGYWKDVPLSVSIVNDFNVKYPLYDVKYKRAVDYYNADADNSSEWIVYHDIFTSFYDDNGTIVDGKVVPKYTQNYTFTQTFFSTLNEQTIFKYRPIIEEDITITSILFDYQCRLVNIKDDVQFLRTASYGITGNNVSDYFTNTIRLDGLNVDTYNVFNKINQIEQKIEGSFNKNVQTKYTKVFYNSNDIVLDNNGDYMSGAQYSMNLSNSPKNYKFIFRKYDKDGVLTIMDLSDSVYKLYTRSSKGEDIVIEPTYSTNMNSVLGEVEFYISKSNILKLKGVSKENRFMSIVVVNTDNSIYSMFDFTYE